jgi:hypothetical protein
MFNHSRGASFGYPTFRHFALNHLVLVPHRIANCLRDAGEIFLLANVRRLADCFRDAYTPPPMPM